MKRCLALFAGIFIYMEVIYHLAIFGFQGINPVLFLPSMIMMAGLQAMLTGFFRRKGNTVLLGIFMILDYLIYAVQLVYISIFKQPLLGAAVTNAGQAALSNYWREMLVAIGRNVGYLLLLALPLGAAGLLLGYKILRMRNHGPRGRLGSLSCFLAGMLGTILLLLAGFHAKWNWYEEYQEFYDPSMIAEKYGVLAAVQRDLLGDVLPPAQSALDAWNQQESSSAEMFEEDEESSISGNEEASGLDGGQGVKGPQEGEKQPVTEDQPGTEEQTGTEQSQEPEEPDTSPNVLPINFEKLREIVSSQENSEELLKLVNFMEGQEPTNKNEYTGMFEGYNLIYLTAEGFSPYAIHEELTPTLYKLTHSGFVIEDYYVPLWQTSTSDGEYVNLTGLIPDQQFSMRRSAVNVQPYALPAFFAKEGAKSFAYHNNDMDYYKRHLSHPNLGYDYKASILGKLSKEEWGSQLFEMEEPEQWPTSDLNMMKATLPEYINQERFHVYYMTVSGHMNYNFIGNSMARKHKDAVADLPYSEEGRAYIACNIELDRALEYLITELEKAGKLENTVIALSSDHYPYDMNMANLEELAGRPLDGTLDLYRNSLILWNSEMETVEIEKTCSALDLLPTLLNLFGFEYDSRLYAGKDMLSDSPSLVIFSNRSFITDMLEYDRKIGAKVSRTEAPVDEAYYQEIKAKVKEIYEYSAGVLNQDFYRYVEQAVNRGAF